MVVVVDDIQNIPNIFQYDLYWHWFPPYALLCGKWNARVEQKAIYGCSFPMQVHQYFIIVHQVLTHLIHTFTHPITHISPHYHSLGGKDNSLMCLASTTKAKTNTKPRGRRRKDTSL